MKLKIHFLSFFLLIVFLTSCFKEDDIIPRHSKGSVKTDTIQMSDSYKFQVYYDLSDSTSRSENLKTLTDIGFDCRENGWQIILNTADFVKAIDLGNIELGIPQDTTGRKMTFDKSDGNPDSLAIGKWFEIIEGDTVSKNHVYLINRGMDEIGNSLGIIQFVIDSLTHGTYYFRWTGMSGGEVKSGSVTKDRSKNFNWFSFAGNGNVVNIEPDKDNWDLIFTQYTSLLYTDEGEAYPYLVTGVLLNRNGVKAIMDTTLLFQDITLEKALLFDLSSDLDVIGYEWKSYDFTGGFYSVISARNYIIRTNEGVFYKLRFVGFYNASGAKGYPVIEYQTL